MTASSRDQHPPAPPHRHRTCSARLFALQCSTAASALSTRTIGTTGPKGSSQAILISGVTWSSSVGQMRLPSLPVD
jgi:hypothetical protein